MLVWFCKYNISYIRFIRYRRADLTAFSEKDLFIFIFFDYLSAISYKIIFIFNIFFVYIFCVFRMYFAWFLYVFHMVFY